VTYFLHPQAEQELADAAAFYEERAGAALARTFLSEFERVATLLVQSPHLGTPASGPFRIYPLRRFPYSVVYRSANEGLRILVVAHQHRRPSYWRGRG
jgi:toxin ParE1/3/4